MKCLLKFKDAILGIDGIAVEAVTKIRETARTNFNCRVFGTHD